MTKQIDTLLKDRGHEYGDAWYIGGEAIGFLKGPLDELIRKAPQYTYSWIMILNKLIRACATPYNIDHWKDIQGYAQLVADDIYDNNHKWKETANSVPEESSGAGS